MALYHKWDVKNGFTYVLTFFSLISKGLGGVACSSLLLLLTRSQYGMFKRPEQSNDKNYSGNPHAMSIIFHFPCYAFICQLEKLFTASSSLVLLTFYTESIENVEKKMTEEKLHLEEDFGRDLRK